MFNSPSTNKTDLQAFQRRFNQLKYIISQIKNSRPSLGESFLIMGFRSNMALEIFIFQAVVLSLNGYLCEIPILDWLLGSANYQ